MPNTLNVKECTFSPDSLNSNKYLSDPNGRVYMLWVQSSPVFNPPNLPVGWSIFTGYHVAGHSWTFEPVNGFLVLNDENQNTWIRYH